MLARFLFAGYEGVEGGDGGEGGMETICPPPKHPLEIMYLTLLACVELMRILIKQ